MFCSAKQTALPSARSRERGLEARRGRPKGWGEREARAKERAGLAFLRGELAGRRGRVGGGWLSEGRRISRKRP
eukprot:5123341-Pleurochrysis_carterae.AAC.1